MSKWDGSKWTKCPNRTVPFGHLDMYNFEKYGKNIINTYFEEVQMETSKLKNMVVLKNLPSNIVDEAIIVLKTNKKVKKLQKIEKNKNKTENDNDKKDKEYILKEAEMLVNNYISKLENNEKKNIFNKEANKKYDKLKKYAIGITAISIIQAIMLIF